eukprot:2647449-Pleurochrysis_carterae.AAC.1
MTVMIAALQVKIGDVLIREGDTLSLNGTTGEVRCLRVTCVLGADVLAAGAVAAAFACPALLRVLLGAMPTSKPEISGKLGKFMEFVQEVKTME